MKVTHTDREGGRWVFDFPVTHALQTNVLARFLRHVGNLGRAGLSVHLYPPEYIQEMESLSRDVERTVLRALSEQFPATE